MAKLEYHNEDCPGSSFKDGYWTKLEYYIYKYKKALDEEDLDLMDRFLQKLSYFHFKQESFIRNKRFQASLKKQSP